MAEDLLVKTSVKIQATAAEVWKALTDPELVKIYFFGTNIVSDWQEGRPILFTGSWEGKEYVDKGTILKIEPEKFLRYNYWSSFSGTEDIPENYATIEYLLESKDGETTLTVSQDGLKDQAAVEHSRENWQLVLNGLKELLEK